MLLPAAKPLSLSNPGKVEQMLKEEGRRLDLFRTEGRSNRFIA